MNFAALPPEVNSGLMYTGPGSGPMIAAATAWDTLAAELHSAAAGYEAVIAELTSGIWSGPSSAAMAASASPYVVWLNATAAQAEKTALQAKAAVAAYEAAFTMTVPPPVIAANRAQLMTLLATNVLGQNAAAIAATEAHYGEMWAQDATAMYGYSALSTNAGELEPFLPAPQTSNPAGPLSQTAAQGDSAGNLGQTLLSRAASSLPAPGSSESALPFPLPAPADLLPEGLFDWLSIIADETALGIALPMSILGVWLAGAAMYFAEQDSREIFDTQDVLRAGQQRILNAFDQLGVHEELPSTEGLRVPHEAVVTSAVGEAFPIGSLSTPISWAETAPEIRNASFSTPLGAPASTSPAGLGTAFGQMALAGMGGSALAGAVNQSRGESGKAPAAAAAAGSAKTSSDSAEQSPAASEHSPVTTSVTELAAGIRELGELHDAGYLTGEEFAEQKRRLLAR